MLIAQKIPPSNLKVYRVVMFLRKYIGELISFVVMPSQMGGYNSSLDISTRQSGTEGGVVFNSFTIESTNNATINYCEYKKLVPSPSNLSEKNQKIIIYAVGNGDYYENHHQEYLATATNYSNCIIVGFNFRNVGIGKGISFSENHWIDDAIAVINVYRRQGIPVENILLSGHSLGAAILTMAAAKIYENDRIETSKKGLDKNTVMPTALSRLNSSVSISFILTLTFNPIDDTNPTSEPEAPIDCAIINMSRTTCCDFASSINSFNCEGNEFII